MPAFVWDVTVKQISRRWRPCAAGAEGRRGRDRRRRAQVERSSRRPPCASPATWRPATGLPTFEKHGFRVVEGDAWAGEPQLQLFAGAMLRPAVEETITAFEEREGVKVTRVYNGCGILVAQMRAGDGPTPTSPATSRS